MSFEDTLRLIVREEVAALAAELRGPDPSALTQEQLGAALQVSRSTTQRLIKDGVPHYLILGSRRFNLAEVQSWLRARSPG